jgi:hypothetical protein
MGRCPHCGSVVRPETICPHCGRDVGTIEVVAWEEPIPQPKYGTPATSGAVKLGCGALILGVAVAVWRALW